MEVEEADAEEADAEEGDDDAERLEGGGGGRG
jgi:hypothetical protein